MKKNMTKSVKAWIAAVAILFGGTGTLAWAMAQQQVEVRGRTVQAAEISSASKSAVAREKTAEDDYVVEEKSMSGGETERTKADMPKGRAVKLADKVFKNCFRGAEVEKIADVRLSSIELSDNSWRSSSYMQKNKKAKTLRLYEGNIYCKDGRLFTFQMDSLTGDMVEIRMLPDEKEKGYGDAAYTEKVRGQIEKKRKQYEKAARTFLNRMIGVEGGAEVKWADYSLCSGSYAATGGEREWEKIVASLETRVNGIDYRFMLDPKSCEVISCTCL